MVMKKLIGNLPQEYFFQTKILYNICVIINFTDIKFLIRKKSEKFSTSLLYTLKLSLQVFIHSF